MNDASRLSRISLTHGQTMFVIGSMHIVEWLDEPGLNSILKKFRRSLVPFSAEELDKPHWEVVEYGYEHLIEVCVALSMVSDGIAFRHVVSLLTGDRPKLHKIYRRAFLEAESGQGASIDISSNDGRKISIGGVYLDFLSVARQGGMLTTTGPRALDPWEALERFMGAYWGLHPRPPIRLSQLATEAVRLAEAAPEVKRGPKRK